MMWVDFCWCFWWKVKCPTSRRTLTTVWISWPPCTRSTHRSPIKYVSKCIILWGSEEKGNVCVCVCMSICACACVCQHVLFVHLFIYSFSPSVRVWWLCSCLFNAWKCVCVYWCVRSLGSPVIWSVNAWFLPSMMISSVSKLWAGK